MQVSDIISLAQTPGPMQGMAQAALAEIAQGNSRSEMVGHSPSSGPGGLNFGDPTPRHASYPSALMQELVARYGEAGVPPSGDQETGSMGPSTAAQSHWRDAMDEYTPSLWDRIKGIGSAIHDDPSIAIDPAADLASYMTPVAGNMRGSQDFSQDASDMTSAWPRSPDHGDPLGVLLQYLPSLGGDVAQMLSPIGLGRPRIRR